MEQHWALLACRLGKAQSVREISVPVCVCIYIHRWMECAWMYACTYAPAWHTGAFHVECMQQSMSKEPHAHLPSCSCRARGPGPHSKRHLSIQPILCNKCQQLTELHTTPSLLLLCYHPSPLQLQPSNSTSGHNLDFRLGCRREVCPLKKCFLASSSWAVMGNERHSVHGGPEHQLLQEMETNRPLQKWP